MRSEHSDDAPSQQPVDPVNDAIRLWFIDQALMHLTRQHGILGLAANVVQTSLRSERDAVVKRLLTLAGGPLTSTFAQNATLRD